MLVTLKDTTFDEGDYGCLKIGDRRYLAYDGDADHYFILKNVDDAELERAKAITVMRGKAIAVNAPIGGSVDEIRAFAVDRPPNSVDFVLVGLLYRSTNGYTWIAGNYVGDALPLSFELALKGDSSNDRLLLPPLHFRYPKEKPSNISKKQLLAKIADETEIRTHSLLRYFGLRDPAKIHLLLLINRDSFSDSDEDEQDSDEDEHEDEQDSDEDEQMEVEAHNLNSSSKSNVWSMEQLNSCLGNCATGNCSHCQELRQRGDS